MNELTNDDRFAISRLADEDVEKYERDHLVTDHDRFLSATVDRMTMRAKEDKRFLNALRRIGGVREPGPSVSMVEYARRRYERRYAKHPGWGQRDAIEYAVDTTLKDYRGATGGALALENELRELLGLDPITADKPAGRVAL